MFGRRPIRWTTEEDEKLRTLIRHGASVNRMAAAVNRRRAAVLKRARDIGFPFPPLAWGRKKSV
jgi:hypothetical protein